MESPISMAEKAEYAEERDITSLDNAEVHTPFVAWLVVLAVALFYFVSVGFLSAAGFFRGAIAGTLGEPNKAIWLANDYILLIVVLGPPLSRIGDSCGRRNLMLAGCLIGTVSCIVIGTASSMNVAIAGTCLFGLSFTQVTNAYAIAAEQVNRHHRGTANALMTIASASGVVVALFAGAKLITERPDDGASYAGWRVLCLLFAGLFALSGVPIALLYWPVPVPNPENKSVMRRVYESCDIIGTVLLGLGITPVIIGLAWGGVIYPWKSAPVLVTLIVGFVLLFVWVAYESFIQKKGLIHHEMLRNRNFLLGVYGAAVEGMIYLLFNAYGGVEISTLYEARTLLFTTRYCAFPIAICVGNPLVAYYVYRRKRVVDPLLLGYLLMLGAAIVIAGLGFASPQTLLTTVTQWAVPKEFIGLASAVAQASRFLGGVIGIAAAGAIVNNKIETRVPAQVAQAALSNGLPQSSLTAFVTAVATGNITQAEAVTGVTPQILEAAGYAVKSASASSFRYAWIFTIPFIILAILSVLLLRPVADVMDGQVDRPSARTEKILEQERADLRLQEAK